MTCIETIPTNKYVVFSLFILFIQTDLFIY